MNNYDRLCSDREYYVLVQKAKVKLLIVLIVINVLIRIF